MKRNVDYGLWTAYWNGSEYVVRRKLNIRSGWEDGNIEEWDRYQDGDEAEEVARTLNEWC